MAHYVILCAVHISAHLVVVQCSAVQQCHLWPGEQPSVQGIYKGFCVRRISPLLEDDQITITYVLLNIFKH